MNRKMIFLVSLLVTAALLFFLLPSDEKKIRHNLELLAEYCSSGVDEAGVALLKKAALAAKKCSDPCRVHIESHSITEDFNRQELRDHILMMKKGLPRSTFTFHDTLVELTADDRAEIITTLSLSGKITDDRFTEAYELNITAMERDGEWLFSAFRVVEFMEK